VMSNK